MNRRSFLGSSGLLLAACSMGDGGERPHVSNPRATDGDEACEPNWDERLTITVGPKDADLAGSRCGAGPPAGVGKRGAPKAGNTPTG